MMPVAADRPAFRAGVAAALVTATLAAVLASGCSILRAAPDDSRYFALSSSTSIAAPARARPDVHLGVGPVKLPGYLDTQALVRSSGGGSVEYVRHAFWAEPVKDGFARALLHRTGERLGTTNTVAYPWYSTTRVDWKVPVDVLRFEATTDGRAVLVARWSIERTSDGKVMGGALSSFEETAGADPVLIVDALSRCVDRLADAIAQALAESAPVARPPL